MESWAFILTVNISEMLTICITIHVLLNKILYHDLNILIQSIRPSLVVLRIFILHAYLYSA
jgi:hypothetical protein